MDHWKEERYLHEKNEELYFHFIRKIAAIIHYLNRATLIFNDGYTLGGKYYREGISKGNENSRYNKVLYPPRNYFVTSIFTTMKYDGIVYYFVHSTPRWKHLCNGCKHQSLLEIELNPLSK
jgi:hypothetical protein